MLIYNRYIFINLLVSLLVVTFIVVGIVCSVQLFKFVYYASKGVKFTHFLYTIFLTLPSLLFRILPVISGLTVYFVYIKMVSNNEILLLQNANMSYFKIGHMVLLFGILNSIFAYYISFILLPDSQTILRSELSGMKHKYMLNILESGAFNKLSPNITLYVDSKKGNILENIVLFHDDSGKITITTANEANINFVKSGQVVADLHNGISSSYDKKYNQQKLSFSNLILYLDDEKLKPKTITKNSSELDIFSLMLPKFDLDDKIRQRFLIDGHNRISWPLYNYIISIFILALIIQFHGPIRFKREGIIYYKLSFIVLIVSIILSHFAIQKIAYSDSRFIVVIYLNIIFWILIPHCLLLYNNKKI